MTENPDALTQLEEHLKNPRQVWIFGAGISADAGLRTRLGLLLNPDP